MDPAAPAMQMLAGYLGRLFEVADDTALQRLDVGRARVDLLAMALRDVTPSVPGGDSPEDVLGLRGGELSRSTYDRAWKRAREAAFPPSVAASALARTPYSLRYACVSTWLNGGVPATQVAEWAGHSVDVLLRVYAMPSAWTGGTPRLGSGFRLLSASRRQGRREARPGAGRRTLQLTPSGSVENRWGTGARAATVGPTATPPEEVRPMNAVRTWVLPLVPVGRLM